MTKWTYIASLLLTLSLALSACNSSPSDDTKLSDLSEDEAQTLCEETCAEENKTLECDQDGVTITLTIDGGQKCIDDCQKSSGESAPSSCNATVGDWRTFSEANNNSTCESNLLNGFSGNAEAGAALASFNTCAQ